MFQSLFSAAAAVLLTAAPSMAQEAALKVGSPAPALAVSEFVKGEAVTSFRTDHTYVVEFWATWCGPCRTSIPHLTKLQKQYAEKATFIGVSVWENDWSKVAPFVEQMGEKMDYLVASDKLDAEGNGIMGATWMQAAQMTGIPTAFVIQEGKVAWIGHPMEMDMPLAELIAGTWSPERQEQLKKEAAERDAKMQTLFGQIDSNMQAKNYGAVLGVIDDIVKLDKNMATRMRGLQFRCLVGDKQTEKYTAIATQAIAGEEVPWLYELTWTLVDPAAKFPLTEADFALAHQLGNRTMELTEKKDPTSFHILARVHFTQGQVAKAIELQKQALEMANADPRAAQMLKSIQQTLEEYEAAAQG